MTSLSPCALRGARLRKRPAIASLTILADINLLKVGDLVTLVMDFKNDPAYGETANHERFWVRILDITASRTFLGKIDEEMVYASIHGLDQGDEVTFFEENIFQVRGR